ncbi:hypothetical protein ACMAUO_08700 [Gluconacetobacter sp. Hr-1-5]|uniref:hypothetical protein n=1 Tax=Gluconacetobacter sp. Hr-1-5 TaxID=3395370 RepID=UPI003B529F2A
MSKTLRVPEGMKNRNPSSEAMLAADPLSLASRAARERLMKAGPYDATLQDS